MAERIHRPDCPAQLAWDIPGACQCDRPMLVRSPMEAAIDMVGRNRLGLESIEYVIEYVVVSPPATAVDRG